MRPSVAGGEAAGFAPDFGAELGVVGQLGGGDGDFGETVVEAEEGEFADTVRQEVEADAKLADAGNGLEDFDLDTSLGQAESGGESAGSGACDQNFHEFLSYGILGARRIRVVSIWV